MAENKVKISFHATDDTASGVARVRAAVRKLQADMNTSLKQSGTKAGDDFGKGFSDRVQTHTEKMHIKVVERFSESGTQSAEAFAQKFAGRLESETGKATERAGQTATRRMTRSGDESGDGFVHKLATKIDRGVAQNARRMETEFGRSGNNSGREFGRNASRRVETEFTRNGRRMGGNLISRIIHGISGGIQNMGERAFSGLAEVTERVGFESGQKFAMQLSKGMKGGGGAIVFVVATILASAAAAAISATVAAISGAIVLGVGGAIIGIGVLMAAKAKEVRKTWSHTLGSLKKDFADAAKPLEPVLIRAGKLVEKLGHKFAPTFKAAMEASVPTLNNFLDRIDKGFSEAAKSRGFLRLTDAFNSLLLNIDIEGFIKDASDALGDLGDGVQQNIGPISDILNGLLKAVPGVIKLFAKLLGNPIFQRGLTALTKAFGDLMDVFKDKKTIDAFAATLGILTMIFAGLLEMVAFVVRVFYDFIDICATTGRAVKKLFGMLKNKTVHLAVSGYNTIKHWIDKIRGWIRSWKGKTVHLAVSGYNTIKHWIDRIKGWIRSWKGKTVKLAVTGYNTIRSIVNRVKGWINSIKGKVVTIGARLSGLASKFFASGGVVGASSGFAHGGVVGRAAGGGPRSNTVLVGEQGPELVNLAPGSMVTPAGKTRQMLGQGGGPTEVVLKIEASDSKTAKFLVELLRQSIKNTHGGNVQKALGAGAA